ncbi:hypothetical protein A3I40_01850 [Candidatus Uhrbacteria bacterium RIFCSPLOWO2_02_FULL_48_12]|uniref:Uncharacterized protein n=1 Tax=Candidatus Uhrbacteria bacterium RIFCSPLOWO2_02_FULL_48_12 TaxID=1802407 RepID=A0A1F7V6G6_9BACT|nr:MAG: hypothetical protein A3I40_01850 [Candidatus Uhrbacteria bacterium RIFCSPLOWO2_02_FULL_48_12]
MNYAIIIAAILSSGFLGFAIGRVSDKYSGRINAPHHWIYGLIFIVIGIIYINYINHWTGMLSLLFGKGHFISDLDDFLHMRIWGVDEPHEWKFWSVK